MKRLVSGSILRIPLLQGFGFAYAKYIDLMKLNDDVTYPDVIKTFNFRTEKEVNNVTELNFKDYLISPLLVAGLRPTIKKGLWSNIGKLELEDEDHIIPDFKGGSESYDDLERGDWFIYEKCQLESKTKVNYERVKYLQPFSASGTGRIEILLTMYFIIFENTRIADHFDLNNDTNQWCYNQVLNSPILDV